MGSRGPVPAPTSLKLLQGTKPSRINQDEPVPGAAGVACPGNLPGRVQEIWGRLAPDLIDKGVLTPWDVDAFVCLCAAIVANQDAIKIVAEGGAIVDGHVSSAWRLLRDSSSVLVTLGGRFGMNPSDRQNLSVGAQDDPSKGADRLLS